MKTPTSHKDPSPQTRLPLITWKTLEHRPVNCGGSERHGSEENTASFYHYYPALHACALTKDSTTH